MFDPIVRLWKLVTAFRGVGSRTINCGEEKPTFEVTSDGALKAKGKSNLPLYPFMLTASGDPALTDRDQMMRRM